MRTHDSGRLSAALVTTTIIAGLGACTSDNIRSDYDSAANFSQYRTYDFVPGAGKDESRYGSVISEYMIDAISIEMEKRGYVRSSDPDLLINFNAILHERSKLISSSPPHRIVNYANRRGDYAEWLGYRYAAFSYVLYYTEGTFNIDVVDARRQQLVWEAESHGQVSRKDLDDRVYERVPRYFAQYPFTAGSGIPRTP